jgi:ribosome-associated translation inhibitor RaiA
MQVPLKIVFRDVPASTAVEAKVTEHVRALERYFDRLTGCRVTVARPHRHQHKGQPYEVSIRLTVPGGVLNVIRGRSRRGAQEDVYVLLHDAFHAARRALEDYARKLRGNVKAHQPRPRRRNALELTPAEHEAWLLSQPVPGSLFDGSDSAQA